MNFGRPFLNSVIVSLFTTFLSVLVATMAGYGFAKFRFKNKNLLFLFILGTIMVPGLAVTVESIEHLLGVNITCYSKCLQHIFHETVHYGYTRRTNRSS